MIWSLEVKRAYKQPTDGYNAIERDADDDSENCDALTQSRNDTRK